MSRHRKQMVRECQHRHTGHMRCLACRRAPPPSLPIGAAEPVSGNRPMRSPNLALSAVTLLAIALLPARLHGQGVVINRVEPDTQRNGPTGSFVLDALGVRSQGEFRDYVYGGLGIGGTLLVQPRRNSLLGLRVDGAGIIYGSETYRVPLSSTIGGRIQVDVNTTNNIFVLGLGPQLTAPTGAVRPYLGGTVGLASFYTRSGVSGSGDNWDFADTYNFSRTKIAWTASSGFYIPVHAGKNPWSIDIGATYHWNGEMEYLRKGGIVDNPDGTITLNTIRSQADFLSFRLGVRFGQ